VFQVNEVRVGLADREAALQAAHLFPGAAPLERRGDLDGRAAGLGEQRGP
jgi:hypothetical protein